MRPFVSYVMVGVLLACLLADALVVAHRFDDTSHPTTQLSASVNSQPAVGLRTTADFGTLLRVFESATRDSVLGSPVVLQAISRLRGAADLAGYSEDALSPIAQHVRLQI